MKCPHSIAKCPYSMIYTGEGTEGKMPLRGFLSINGMPTKEHLKNHMLGVVHGIGGDTLKIMFFGPKMTHKTDNITAMAACKTGEVRKV